MPTEIQVRNSNFVDAGLTDQFFADRGFTVTAKTVVEQRLQIVLAEELDNGEMNEIERDLINALLLLEMDVSFGSETETQAERRYNRVIDRCQRKRIRRGFESPPASGDVFGLDVDSQARWLRLRLQRNNLVYPFRILEQDNRGGIDILDVGDMNAFFNDFHAAILLIEDETTQIKRDINTEPGAAGSRALAVTYLELPGNCPAIVNDLGI